MLVCVLRKTQKTTDSCTGDEDDLASESKNRAISLVFRTYPYYVDRGSRRAVQDTFSTGVFFPPHTSRLVELFQEESLKNGLAASNTFVLVEWGSVLLQHLAGSGRETFDQYGVQVVQADGRVLDTLLSSSLRAKPSLKKSGLVVTRRAIRKILQKLGRPAIVLLVETLTARGQPLGGRSSILLGIIAGVCARSPSGKEWLREQKEKYFEYYIREMLGSRTPVQDHIAAALNDFFNDFSTIDDLQQQLLPQLEKGLLRAPEVILKNLLPNLFVSIPEGIDTAPIVADSLCKPLLASLKSSNASVRDGATTAFSTLLDRSRSPKHMAKITEGLLAPLQSSKLTTDHRTLHARVLAMLPPVISISESVCDTLCGIIAKESNEMALESEVFTLLRYVQYVYSNDSLLKKVSNLSSKGLSDKKPGIRRQWILKIGEFLWKATHASESSPSTPALQELRESCFSSYAKLTDEILSNPVTAAASGLAVGALIFAEAWNRFGDSSSEALRPDKSKNKLFEEVLQANTKSSTMLNPRVYAKFLEDDFHWELRALVTTSDQIQKHCNAEQQLAWSQSMIFLIVASDVSRTVKNEAVSALSRLCLQQGPSISDTIIKGLWAWYRSLEESEKEAAAILSKSGTSQLIHVLRSICPSKDSGPEDSNRVCHDTNIRAQLVQMLVLCRPEIIPGASWINLCLRMSQDPGLIASDMASQALKQVENHLFPADDQNPITVRAAACNAAAELAFVAPATITPLLLEVICRNLPVSELARCSPTEAAIARTPEGITFVDVLSSQRQRYAIDKNARDYETMKWEEDVRSQLASKKSSEKKLTADDKAKINAQLIKEDKIRKEVRSLEQRLRGGIGIIQALAVGPPTDATLWLGPSMSSLSGVVEAGASLLVGDSANEAYLACSNLVSPRLGSLRPFIGIATLRGLGAQVTASVEQESLCGVYQVYPSCDFTS